MTSPLARERVRGLRLIVTLDIKSQDTGSLGDTVSTTIINKTREVPITAAELPRAITGCSVLWAPYNMELCMY